jgi:hypothetical protein
MMMVMMTMSQRSHFTEMLGEMEASVNLDVLILRLRFFLAPVGMDNQQLLWLISD